MAAVAEEEWEEEEDEAGATNEGESTTETSVTCVDEYQGALSSLCLSPESPSQLPPKWRTQQLQILKIQQANCHKALVVTIG